MSSQLAGALVGILLAVVELVVLRRVAARIGKPEARKVLDTVGLVQLVLFPVIGWFLGPVIAGE